VTKARKGAPERRRQNFVKGHRHSQAIQQSVAAGNCCTGVGGIGERVRERELPSHGFHRSRPAGVGLEGGSGEREGHLGSNKP
jgi:hypothetical protein